MGIDDITTSTASTADRFPNSKINDVVDLNHRVVFSPPLFLQRYHFVNNIARERNICRVIDAGCSEGGLVKYMTSGRRRHNFSLRQVIGIDVDTEALSVAAKRAVPLPLEHIELLHDCRIDFFKGSLTLDSKAAAMFIRDACLASPSDSGDSCESPWMIASVDVVEHICVEELEAFADALFFHFPAAFDDDSRIGKIDTVVLTTPNSDRNVEFSQIPFDPCTPHFRHPDHKFEFSSEQYSRFCEWILRRFPWWACCDLSSIGNGFTQAAVFHRKLEDSLSHLQPLNIPFSAEDVFQRCKLHAGRHLINVRRLNDAGVLPRKRVREDSVRSVDADDSQLRPPCCVERVGAVTIEGRGLWERIRLATLRSDGFVCRAKGRVLEGSLSLVPISELVVISSVISEELNCSIGALIASLKFGEVCVGTSHSTGRCNGTLDVAGMRFGCCCSDWPYEAASVAKRCLEVVRRHPQYSNDDDDETLLDSFDNIDHIKVQLLYIANCGYCMTESARGAHPFVMKELSSGEHWCVAFDDD